MLVFLFVLNVVCFLVNARIWLTKDCVVCMVVSGFSLGTAIMLLSDMVGDK